MNKSLFYFILFIVVAFSFYFHSSLFSPILNSDDAVVVLMIYDFHLPEDLYYWNANRFGSLVPLIGQFFYKVLHLSPIISEAFTHYLLLVLGYFGFASLFKSNLTKILFAIIWFLPPLRMLEVLKLSQGEQYCLIGMAVFLMNKIQSINKQTYQRHFLVVLTVIILIISIWVSDITIATIFVILFFQTLFFLRANKFNYSLIFKMPEIYYSIIGTIICYLFILYAKKHAVQEVDYYDFFDTKIIFESFKIFKDSIVEFLIFKANEPLTSIYTYLTLALVFYVGLNRSKIKSNKNNFKWSIIFGADLIVIFGILLSSKWVYLNGVSHRYFVCSYISFWIAFLIMIESVVEIKLLKKIQYLILVTVVIGGLGTIYNLKYIWPQTLKPKIEVVSEFKSLGKIGIIADYWNSYLASCADPDNIKATPNEQSTFRNKKLVEEVFKQNNLYVIKDMWMENFPDTLKQFGHVLIIDGKPFKMGDCDVCKYKPYN